MTEIPKRRYKGVDIDSKRRKLTGDNGGLQRRKRDFKSLKYD